MRWVNVKNWGSCWICLLTFATIINVFFAVLLGREKMVSPFLCSPSVTFSDLNLESTFRLIFGQESRMREPTILRSTAMTLPSQSVTSFPSMQTICVRLDVQPAIAYTRFSVGRRLWAPCRGHSRPPTWQPRGIQPWNGSGVPRKAAPCS